jgi:hypothetical protein
VTSSLAWIHQNYNVPAFRGVEVTYLGKPAVIVGGSGPWVRLRVPGQKRLVVNHPTYATRYPVLPLPVHPKGWCPFCMTERTILEDGTVGRHHRHGAKNFRPGDRPCPGIGQKPWAICSWTIPAPAPEAAPAREKEGATA